MPRRKRSAAGQTKHDRKVRQIARELRAAGWDVQADLPGDDRPDPIGTRRHIPDLVASKRGHKRIIEVETPDSIDRDRKQQETFRRSAGQQANTTFRIELTD